MLRCQSQPPPSVTATNALTFNGDLDCNPTGSYVESFSWTAPTFTMAAEERMTVEGDLTITTSTATGETMTLNSGSVVETITTGTRGDLSLNVASGADIEVAASAQIRSSGNLTFSTNNDVDLGTEVLLETFNVEGDMSLNIPALDDQTWTDITINTAPAGIFTLGNSHSITLSGTTAVHSSVDWSSLTSLTVDATAQLNANSRGCKQTSTGFGFIPDVSNDCAIDSAGTNGGGQSNGSSGGAGSGHGGKGGIAGNSTTYYADAGGETYDSATNPVLVGAAGAYGTTNVLGGNGGGLVKVSLSGTLTHNGPITADGGRGMDHTSRDAGGGSGGSINITIDTYTCSTGTFSADGGDGGNGSSASKGGGGGGGRVAVNYTTDSVSCPLSGLTAAGVAAGGLEGGGNATDGETGTLNIDQAICGDGGLDSGETCDDGGTDAGDGCSATCQEETGFSCTGEPSTCTAICGDGLIKGSEACDDNNTTPSDGCSATCTIETDYSCSGEPSTCSIDLSGWINRHPITINASCVDENQTNFAVLLADGNFLDDAYTNTQTNGEELRFSSDQAGDTQLAFEVVNWNKGAKTSEVWVKIPSLSSTVDNQIYVWYNNASASALPVDEARGSENVWASEFKAVYHLNESATDEGSSTTHVDSTSNDNDGTQSGNASTASGKIGTAQDFDGTNDLITVPDSASLDISGTNLTIELWASSTTSTTWDNLVQKDAGSWANGWGIIKNAATTVALYINSYTVNFSPATFTNDDNFHHIVGVYDGTNITTYVDTSAGTPDSFTGSITTNNNQLQIGQGSGSTSYSWPGKIDEVRIYEGSYSTGRISTSYNNQNTPATCSTAGAAESTSVQATEGIPTTLSITNSSPVFTVVPSDGGSNNGSGTSGTTGNPTDVDADVTLTATAKDLNGDQYYLALCKTDAITAGDNNVPTCTGGSWAISAATNSDAQATVTYTALVADVESNDWYAFVCDKVVGGGVCSASNRGVAQGTITFTGEPADGDRVEIGVNSGDAALLYEFDSNATCTGSATNICVTINTPADGEEVAAALAAAEPAGNNNDLVQRGTVVYVYATDKGAPVTPDGNFIVLSDSCGGCADTNAVIAVSGPVLSGGNDDTADPFFVNHRPTFSSVSTDDGTGGTIEPGEIVRFLITVADPDSSGGADTIVAVACDRGNTFNFATGSCSSTELCRTSAGTGAQTCNFPGSKSSAPVAHGSHDFEIFIFDNHLFDATDADSTETFAISDVAPFLNSYTATDFPAPAAGGSDPVDFSASIGDNNGDNDVTAVEGIFFDDNVVTNTCTPDQNDCYIAATCTLEPATISTPTAAGTKTSLGTDTDLTASCQVIVFFNANESNNWEVHVNPTDGLGQETGLADSNLNINNPALTGIALIQSSIGYGAITPGGVSIGKPTEIANLGNQVLDVFIDGTDMTDGSNTIPASQQRWHHTTQDFAFDTTAAKSTLPAIDGPNGYTLTALATGTASNNLNIAITNSDTIDCQAEVPSFLASLIGGTTPNFTLACDLDDLTQGGGNNPLTGARFAAGINFGTGASEIELSISAAAAGTGDTIVTPQTVTLVGGVTGSNNLTTSASGTDEAGGCLNRNLVVRDVATSTATDETIYWKLRIPSGQPAGSYTGSNSFKTTAATTCATGEAQ